MTNFEKIKKLSLEEMAEFLNNCEENITWKCCSKEFCDYQQEDGSCEGVSQGQCINAVKNFLKAEAK